MDSGAGGGREGAAVVGGVTAADRVTVATAVSDGVTADEREIVHEVELLPVENALTD